MICEIHDIQLTKVRGLGIEETSFCSRCHSEAWTESVQDGVVKITGIKIEE